MGGALERVEVSSWNPVYLRSGEAVGAKRDSVVRSVQWTFKEESTYHRPRFGRILGKALGLSLGHTLKEGSTSQELHPRQNVGDASGTLCHLLGFRRHRLPQFPR